MCIGLNSVLKIYTSFPYLKYLVYKSPTPIPHEVFGCLLPSLLIPDSEYGSPISSKKFFGSPPPRYTYK